MGLRTYVGRNFKRLVTPEEHPKLFMNSMTSGFIDDMERLPNGTLPPKTMDSAAQGATGETKEAPRFQHSETILRMPSSL